MGKGKNGFLVFCAVLVWSCAVGQPILNQQPEPKQITELREAVIKTASRYLHVREKTGRNDGPEVVYFLQTVGRVQGDAWCSAFACTVYKENGIPNPMSGWSPAWFTKNIVYKRATPGIKGFVSRPGQTFGLYYPEKKRVAHVGIIESETRLHYNTIEGNTNSAGSNEGDGVYKKIRKKETIYIISDYILAPDRKVKIITPIK